MARGLVTERIFSLVKLTLRFDGFFTMNPMCCGTPCTHLLLSSKITLIYIKQCNYGTRARNFFKAAPSFNKKLLGWLAGWQAAS
jgi:hypothetical protein